MIAHCGLDCAKCEGYIATQAEDEVALARVAAQWSAQFDADIRAEQVRCDGCRQEGRKSAHCDGMCEIRKCCLRQGFATCIECRDFPCEDEAFVLKHAPHARVNLDKMRK